MDVTSGLQQSICGFVPSTPSEVVHCEHQTERFQVGGLPFTALLQAWVAPQSALAASCPWCPVASLSPLASPIEVLIWSREQGFPRGWLLWELLPRPGPSTAPAILQKKSHMCSGARHPLSAVMVGGEIGTSIQVVACSEMTGAAQHWTVGKWCTGLAPLEV